MNKVHTAILLFAFSVWSLVSCEPSYSEASVNAADRQNTLLSEIDAGPRRIGSTEDDSNYDKRVERYAFGLGRRAYTYTNGGNGVKRLPVYNFGLGKRARPYSFGLGKRAEYEDEQYDGDFDRNAYNEAFMGEKRNRPYSFGLGKREPSEDVARRGFPNRYGFGLGRR